MGIPWGSIRSWKAGERGGGMEDVFVFDVFSFSFVRKARGIRHRYR